jgi:DNA repair exonuclease SbcCD nuclease subunit
MTDAPITLLVTGDLHLGRHPARIPSDRDGPQFSPGSVWENVVRHAVSSEVHALLITGDVVDYDNRYFEAYGPFQSGIRSLNRHDVPVFLVGGNHDWETLPHLIDDTHADNVTLLGRNGSWERRPLEVDGRAALWLDGWSFPSRQVTASPLATYDPEPDEGLPVVGMLHADMDATGSTYAPVPRREFLDTPAAAWMLGHLHAPGIRREQGPLILYPVSPQPLDPGESGVHGPWLVQVEPDGSVHAEQLPLATVRYESVPVDVAPAEELRDIAPLIHQAAEEHLQAGMENHRPELVLLRATLAGRCAAHSALHRERARLVRDLQFEFDSVPALVDTLQVDTRPPVNLQELAQGTNPAARIARLLMDLEANAPLEAHGELVQEALDAMREAHSSSAYNALRRARTPEQPTRREAVERLQTQALLLLDTLLAQKEERR